jgi:hypothetical protein
LHQAQLVGKRPGADGSEASSQITVPQCTELVKQEADLNDLALEKSAHPACQAMDAITDHIRWKR